MSVQMMIIIAASIIVTATLLLLVRWIRNEKEEKTYRAIFGSRPTRSSIELRLRELARAVDHGSAEELRIYLNVNRTYNAITLPQALKDATQNATKALALSRCAYRLAAKHGYIISPTKIFF